MRAQAAGYHLGSDKFFTENGLRYTFLVKKKKKKNPLANRMSAARQTKTLHSRNEQKVPKVRKTGSSRSRRRPILGDRPKDKRRKRMLGTRREVEVPVIIKINGGRSFKYIITLKYMRREFCCGK